MKKLLLAFAVVLSAITGANAETFYVRNDHATCSVGFYVWVQTYDPRPGAMPSAHSMYVTLAPGTDYEFDDANPADWPGVTLFPAPAGTTTRFLSALFNTPNMAVPTPDGCYFDATTVDCSMLLRPCMVIGSMVYDATLAKPSGGSGGWRLLP